LAQFGKLSATRRCEPSRAWLAFACWALSACSGEISSGESSSGESSSAGGTGTRAPEGDTPAVEHWSFEAPRSVEPSSGSEDAWVINEIDGFVTSRLAALGRSPAPPASPEKLVRRVTLTLTGLLPSLEEVDAFVADPSEAAYRALVDRLLASPRYAEHMASAWLDLARYADTDGFQYDQTRDVWPWRDWVLQAFDTNMPFDQFTLWQLAGDLLPNASEQSILATAFNRNHPIQNENGLLLDEFRDRYVADRVDALGKAWLGLTVGCARCHDHKFDPTLATDYYQLYDCFNQIDEKDNGVASAFSPSMPLPSPFADALKVELDERITALAEAGASQATLSALRHDAEAVATVPSARIMLDQATQRSTRVLVQGRYDLPVGNPVSCDAPHFLPPFPEGAPNNRLGLAQWLTMPDHPLTARVAVNRMWHQHFGRGLLPSLDNFGLQATAPEYQPLLDWMATYFVDSGWDVKGLHRLIVTSNTFRQASASDEASLAADPDNAWLGRGPRFRLSAEVIRDVPLAASGLLVHRLGGPPAWPYQPENLWEELSWEYAQLSYPRIEGDGLYRRSLYSFWKRTLPPPFMSLFDAPDRESAASSRELGVSPQQALALLHGEQFIEAARQLAARLWQAESDGPSGSTSRAAIAAGFRLLTSRPPNETELAILTELYDAQLELARREVTATTRLQSTGRSARSSVAPEQAALTQVVRVLFNLGETVTQE
jgi:hypothetical protein